MPHSVTGQGKNNLISRSLFFSLLLLAVSIPTNTILINISIAVFSVLSIANFLIKRQLTYWPFRAIPLLLISLYGWHLFSFFFSTNSAEALFNLEKKLFFAIFPIVALFAGISITKLDFVKILRGFAYSTILVGLCCLAFAIPTAIQSHSLEPLIYHQLLSPFKLHAVYYGMYLLLSFSIITSEILERRSFKINSIIFYTTTLILIMILTILISSRIILVALVGVILLNGYYLIVKLNKIKTGLIIIIGLMAILCFGIMQIPFLENRITELFYTSFNFNPEQNNANGITLRSVKWACSLQGLMEHPLTGVGIGNMQDYLQDCYAKNNFWGQVFHYNSHNQFIQFGLGTGLIGIILYSLILALGMKFSYQLKSIIALSFYTIVLLCSITESILERQQGVIFFVFFLVLLLYLPKSNNSPS